MITRRSALRAADGELTPALIGLLLVGWSHRPESEDADDFSLFDLADADLARLWLAHEHALLAEAKRLHLKPTSVCWWARSPRPVYYGVYLLRLIARQARQRDDEDR